jgi:beta-glucosidase
VSPRYQGSGSSLINPARMEQALEEMRKYAPGCSYSPGYQADRPDEALIGQACDAAAQADVAVVFAGLPPQYESEGFDREHMRIPESHNELIRRVAAANPHTVVVLMKGAPVEMPWADSAKAILDAYLGGQGGSGGIADVLFGLVNPSGKLAETIPIKLQDGLSSRYFPMGPVTVEYRESVFVGYRWYDSARVPIKFPFGHGLSYTSFEYADLALDRQKAKAGEAVTASLTVRNAGSTAGDEVVQLYVRDVESTAYRPEKELKGFEKVFLLPGEERRVSFTLGKRAFACYNASLPGWHVESGEFELLAGSSSADIRLKAVVHVESDLPGVTLPSFKSAAPEYYDLALAAGGISEGSFEAVYGKALPAGSLPNRARFTLTSSVDDVRHTMPGRFLYRMMVFGMGKMAGPHPDKLVMKMMERFVGEMPLRNLVVMSGGKFPMGMMKFLLGWMNVGRK